MRLMNLPFSGACSIELTTESISPSGVMKGVILTGGRPVWGNDWKNNKVTHYDLNGFVADLPELRTGRMDHACSFYHGYASVEGRFQKRRVITFFFKILLITCQDLRYYRGNEYTWIRGLL